MWFLLACHRLEKIVPEELNQACEDPIYAPQAGYMSDDPVLAEPHALVLGNQPTPFHVHLTWHSDPATSQAVLWRTDADTLASSVEYGTDTSYGNVALGASFLATEGVDEDGRIHEVRLCGLLPGMTYHYRVGGEGGWSQDYTFTTAPDPTTAPEKIVFGIVGDSRDNQSTWGELIGQMEAYGPDFYLFSGDMVDLGVNMDEWDAWFDAIEQVSPYKPVQVVHGNHEFLARQYFAFFALPNNEQWYGFQYGNLFVAGLNDTTVQPADIDTQATWLDAELKKTSANMKVVFHHIPAYTSCNTHPADTNLQQKWSPVEEANGVAIDFTGHNHNYERSVPLLAGAETTADLGTTYIVSAGAGASLYDNSLEQPYTAVAAVTYHFVIVEVEGDAITSHAYDIAGNLIDTFTTTRSNSQ